MGDRLFMAISRRRISCPLAVQHLWDAVKVIRFQRQVPDVDRITKYMARVHNMSSEEVGRQLNYCVRDGLMILTKRVKVQKGSKTGVATEGYKLPKEKVDKDCHDWYCFQCHSAGDVISCTSCYRVYHLSCIEREDLPENDVKHKFICNICKKCTSTEETSKKIKKIQLNRLLYRTTGRLKEKIPLPWTEHTIATVAPSTYVSDRLQFQSQLKGSDLHMNMKSVLNEKDPWRIELLIFKTIDLQMIEDKSHNGEYKNIEEFRADVLTFIHNIIIFHGVNSSLADYGRSMLRDCNNDLEEILRCQYCYKYSIQKNFKFWFCKPCKPPHDLVYAKQEDLPYWPAKVLNIEGDNYEVRFFGGKHHIGIIDKSQIYPISVNIHSLQSQGLTSQWNKACEELRRHQLQLDKVIIGLTAQSSSSSSDLSSENEDTPPVFMPIQNGKKKNKIKKKINVKSDIKIETDNEEKEEKVCSKEEPVKRKRSRPASLEKKCSPPKKVLMEKKSTPEVIVEKRGRGRPRKIVEPLNTDKTPVKPLKIKVKSPKKNCSTVEIIETMKEKIKTPRNTRSSKTKSTTKESKVDENMTERLKDSHVVENETVSSSCQDSVCSINMQTKPITTKPPKSYISKIRAEMESEKRKAIEQLIEQHKKKIALLKESHNNAISKVKKKQWCVNCECEAIYYCCWNTSYCNPKCQLIHWSSEHKRHCRRKR